MQATTIQNLKRAKGIDIGKFDLVMMIIFLCSCHLSALYFQMLYHLLKPDHENLLSIGS